MDRLAAREREVLQRVVDGDSTKAAARALSLSPRTKTHRASIRAKLKAHNVADVVRIAMNKRAADDAKVTQQNIALQEEIQR